MFDSQGDHQNYWDRRETKLTCKSSRLQTEDVSGLMLEIGWTEAINSFLAVSFVQEPLQRLEDVLSKEVEQRMLNALEEKVDLAIRDLQRCGHLSWGVTRESTVSATPTEICNPTRRLYGFGKERCFFFFFEVCFWADAAMGRGRQLETQINDLTQREDAQPQRWLQTCYKGFGLDVLR